jgi:hypothetical protein
MKGFYRTEQTGRGFRWGNFDVSRLSETAGRGQLLGIEAGGRKFGMYVSDRGHSVRLFEDGQEIPRDTARVASRLAELEGAIRSVQAEHTRVVTAYGTWCRICSPQDGSWPCVVRMELDAVLPPEEQAQPNP